MSKRRFITILFCCSFAGLLAGCSTHNDKNKDLITDAGAAVNAATQNDTLKDNLDGDNMNKEHTNREELQSLFDNLTYTASYKEAGDHNPLITQDYGADPFAMVYKDRVYVYMTQDVYMYDEQGQLQDNNYSKINSLRCISSSDMVNWTDHGWIHVGGIKGVTAWANNSWAPTTAWKKINGKDQFFLYFANSAGGIGVLTADNPTGPFRDPLGKALLTHETPNCSDVVWMFDPAVLMDHDGKAYIYFGGGVPEGKEEAPKTARVIELGADMISTVGEAKVIDAPFLFEDSGINRIGDTYYYSYCSNFSSRAGAKGPYVPDGGEIIYMTGDTPAGPWQYRGSILKNPGYFFGTGGNNHHSMIEFNNKWYMFYHTSLLQDAIGVKGGYRSTNANEVTINPDGTIQAIYADKKGLTQIKAFNPYEPVAAATMANNGGTTVIEEDKKSFKDSQVISVAGIDPGDWIQVSQVDFGSKGADTLTLRISSEGNAGAVRICPDSLDADAVAYAEIPDTGNYKNYVDITVPVDEITGIHDLYFEFAGSGYHFNTWTFTEK